MPLKEIKKICCQFEWWNRDLILLKINPVRGIVDNSPYWMFCIKTCNFCFSCFSCFAVIEIISSEIKIWHVREYSMYDSMKLDCENKWVWRKWENTFNSACSLRLRSCLFCEGRISVLKRWFKTPIQNAVNSGYCSSSSEPERRLYDVI